MTEHMERRRLDLIARQQAGEMMTCPRCGADSMKRPIHTNALSRLDSELYVCDACGTTEAVLAYMKQESPLSQWAAFQPRRPEGDFKAMPAGEAVMEIVRTQTDALARLYRLCRDDPENGEWYRLEAFESCPGLTELWPEPFQAKYMAGRCGAGSLQDRRRGQHPHGGGYRREVSRRQDVQRRVPQ